MVNSHAPLFNNSPSVTKIDSFAAVIEEFKAKVGTLDHLVLNAGFGQRQLGEDTPLDATRAMFETNVFGLVEFNKHALPLLLESKGNITVTSSVAGKLGSPLSTSYSATKFALQGYFSALRIELVKRGVGVTLICPGPVTTEFGAHVVSKVPGQADSKLPTKRTDQMSADRCAELMATAMANRVYEAWISPHPVLLFTYFAQYAPTCYAALSLVLGPRRIEAFEAGVDSYSVSAMLKKKK
eukprot:TRINITY_DN7750_c0_g1_i1.p1 TRINITY_DN7750_c0_g1~~TRINITY_DN7750_c0_g1_i1.p1  ORF type:complete len:240 (-),score=52.79 TRINITY_DN7750_c0_g1_i1:21-740(-)